MKKKTISIIMPNYNYSKYLKTSISAILNQTRKPDKFIIIDDASTDNSIKTIESLIKNHSNVLLIKNKVNMGISRSVSLALSYATSDYLYFTGADDIISNNFLQEMMSFVEKHPDTGICCSLPVFFRNSKKIWADNFNIHQERIFKPKETVELMRKQKFWIATHTSIINSNMIKKELWHNELQYYYDWFWNLNIAFQYKIGFIPKQLAFMRIHKNAYSFKKEKYFNSKKIFSFLIKKIKNKNSILKKRFLKSRALSQLDNKIILFVFFKIKYWEYLPGIVGGKILKLLNETKKKFFFFFLFCKIFQLM